MVLIGQPELKEMLKRPGLRQLDQRITARYHLTPLGLQEAGAYIRHRLQVAGTTDAIFNDAAIRTIYRLSGGVPRLINTLCDRCLLGAYAENKRTVDARLVHSAATEVLGLRPRRRGGLIVASGCFAAVAAAGFVLIDPLDQNLLQYIPLPVPIELVTETSGERSAGHESSSSEASSAAAEDTGIVPATVAQISPTRSQADPPDRQTNLAVYATDLSPTPEPAVGLAPATVPPPGPPPRFEAHAPTSEAPAILSGMFEGEPIAVLDNAAATVPPTAPPTAPLTVAADLGATVNGGRIGNGGGLAPHTPEPEASDRVQLVWGGPGLVGDPANEAPTNPLAEPMIVALPTIPPPPRPPESAQDLFALAEPFGDIESAASSLFQVWDFTFATLKGVTPCGKARYAKLRCLQSQATWHELRIANRPVVITLSDGEDRRIYATVVGLDGDEADIIVDGYSLQSSVGGLSRYWNGDFLLLWRPPLPFAREIKFGRRGDDVAWLRAKLAELGLPTDAAIDEKDFGTPLRDALRTFQRRQGLNVDGIVGPRTLIQINIAMGVPNAPALH